MQIFVFLLYFCMVVTLLYNVSAMNHYRWAEEISV